jgi:hypothetical protein
VESADVSGGLAVVRCGTGARNSATGLLAVLGDLSPASR